MKSRFKGIMLLFVVCYGISARAQVGFLMPAGMHQMDIPFEYVNDFILVTVILNKTLPLKMIFDTGAEHTVLSKREITDALHVRYEREFRLTGADLSTELVAFLARQIHLEILGLPFIAPREDILVLQEDYFRFEAYAGVAVHGILSAKSFSRYIFNINYQKKVITVYDRPYFKLPGAGFQMVPVEVFRNRLYLLAPICFQEDDTTTVKLLLDTGAALPLLLFSNTNSKIQVPEKVIAGNIGMGLGGYLEGFIGRIQGLAIGNFQQKYILTYFQKIDTAQDLTYLNNRNGLVGNRLLNRFQVVIDYDRGYLWLKASKNYRQRYVFDRSGLSIIAGGVTLNQFTVQVVVPGTPAAAAGLLPGDRILRIGGMPAVMLGLPDVQRRLQKKVGKKITLVVLREGKKIKKSFRLRELV
jgi:hypothetical protein